VVQKLGLVRAYSVGGTRLRSTVRPDGVRETTAYRLNELSLVDSPANPASRVALVKVVNGRVTPTSVLADEEEETCMSSVQNGLAARLDGVARQLASGCRPLPSEVNAALTAASRAAGVADSSTCNTVAVRDWSVIGPRIAAKLSKLSAGVRVAVQTSDVQKIAGAANILLLELVNSADKRRAGFAPENGRSADELYAAAAEELRKHDAAGLPQQSETYQRLAAALFRVAPLRQKTTLRGGSLSLDELREAESKLESGLRKWHELGREQNSREYDELSKTYFRVMQMRKAAERRLR
jgi:hypothetical protein